MHMNAQKCYREKTPRIPGKNPTYPGLSRGAGVISNNYSELDCSHDTLCDPPNAEHCRASRLHCVHRHMLRASTMYEVGRWPAGRGGSACSASGRGDLAVSGLGSRVSPRSRFVSGRDTRVSGRRRTKYVMYVPY